MSFLARVAERHPGLVREARTLRVYRSASKKNAYLGAGSFWSPDPMVAERFSRPGEVIYSTVASSGVRYFSGDREIGKFLEALGFEDGQDMVDDADWLEDDVFKALRSKGVQWVVRPVDVNLSSKDLEAIYVGKGAPKTTLLRREETAARVGSSFPPMTPARKKALRAFGAMTDDQLYRVDTQELDRAAFGFDSDTVQQVPLKLLNLSRADYANAKYIVRKFPDRYVPYLDEPLEVKLRGGVFHLEDGHHRYETARLRGMRTLPALVSPDDNPITEIRRLTK